MQRETDTFNLVEVAAPSEHALQEVMKANPQLIPSDDLGLDGELVVVGRETTLASGAIDLLCLAQSGDLVLIEFKTGPQNPDFRHALAQVIDYGSDLWRRSVDDFDRGVVQRYLSSGHCDPDYKGVTDLDGLIGRSSWVVSESEREALGARLAEVLETGDFVFVVAAQRFTSGMSTSLDYLNSTMRRGRFYLVEVVRLQGHDLVAHAARVVASPPKVTGSSGSSVASQANESDFLDRIESDVYRDAIKDIFATCRTLGLTLAWGAKGTSIRIETPDRSERLSIGWAFLEGDQWYGARHLTFGVDEASLQENPSVRPHVLAFVERVQQIPAATPVQSKLRAHIFEPAVVPGAKDSIVAALEELVDEVQAQGNGRER
ncbi:MAG: hypothetical protein ACR2FV_17095 [Ornithinimicrobium sp.]|uniref:hypothetical protein n=1 Tax=Ornithinimicrobium sp. TaxID=1977084 RepID=UPI003D9BA553